MTLKKNIVNTLWIIILISISFYQIKLFYLNDMTILKPGRYKQQITVKKNDMYTKLNEFINFKKSQGHHFYFVCKNTQDPFAHLLTTYALYPDNINESYVTLEQFNMLNPMSGDLVLSCYPNQELEDYTLEPFYWLQIFIKN